MAEAALIGAIIPKLISMLEGKVKLRQNMKEELLEIQREMEAMEAFLIDHDKSAVESRSQLDEAWVKQNQDIRSRFLEVRERNERYRLTDVPINSSAPHGRYDPQQDAIFNDNELVGREEDKRDIISMLRVSDVTLQVVSVSGTGGVGKTSLVKKVFDGKEVMDTFQIRVWITVSRNKLDAILKDLVGQLLVEMKQPQSEELGDMWGSLGVKQEVDKLLQDVNQVELKKMAKKFLRRGRYLVVLDDIWTVEDWCAIRNAFPESPDCKVLTTTRNHDIALAASNGVTRNIFKMEPLSADHSLSLFLKKTSYDEDSFPEQLTEVAQSILKKCGGVPLAIVAICGILVRKEKQTAIEWENIDKCIGAELDGSIKRVLSLGYDDLPYYLKTCYLYLSIFPEDHRIEKNRLIRLWIAEGFVERKDDMTCEQVAENYHNELVQRSLIQATNILNEGIVETYCIHDLLREIILDKAENQRFGTVARNNGIQPQQVRRLSLHKNLPTFKEMQTLGRLRSLFMFDVERPLTKLSVPSLFSKDFSFRLLTVLDMQGAILNEFPTAIVKLRNLKYLNLSHTDLEFVPSSIHSLQNLETLDLRYTRVSILPSAILKLQKLHSLLVYQYKNGTYPVFGFRAPEGLGILQSLRSLFYVDASSGCENVVKQLGLLTQLRQLGIGNFSNENANDLCTSISSLGNLQAFSISSPEKKDQALDLENLDFSSKKLQCLYLTGKLNSLPSWMAALQNLEKLFLRSCELLTDPVDTLGGLPNLLQLELVAACTTKSLLFEAGLFKRLRILDLHEFKRLELVRFMSGSMPKLERFRMVSCPKLNKVPEGIEHLSMSKDSKLTVIDFVNMPSQLKSKAKNLFERLEHIKEANWVNKDQNTLKIERMIAAGRKRPLISTRDPNRIYGDHELQMAGGSDSDDSQAQQFEKPARNVLRPAQTTNDATPESTTLLGLLLIACLLCGSCVLSWIMK